MSSRWSRDLAYKAALYKKSMMAVQELGATVVHGRFEGITVTYDGFGRLQNIEADPARCFGLYTSEKQLNHRYLEKGICEAIFDASQQMKMRKRLHWREVDPTQDYELSDNLPPFPFDHQSMPNVPKEIQVEHLPDGIYDQHYEDPYIASLERQKIAAQEAEVERQFQRALAIESALRLEAFNKKIPLEELRQKKKNQLQRLRKRQARRQALEAKAKEDLAAKAAPVVQEETSTDD